MRATTVFHSRFWRALDWKNILLLAVALCIIGFDLLGRVKVHQHSLGRRVQRAEVGLGPDERTARLAPQQSDSPEGSASWETIRVEVSSLKDAQTSHESSPPPGYVVTRVAPKP